MRGLFLVAMAALGTITSNADGVSEDGVFYHFSTAKSWNNAQNHCVSLGLNLASIHTDDHLTVIDALRGSAHTWIGLVSTARRYDAATSSGYKSHGCYTSECWAWVDGTPTEYSMFTEGQSHDAWGSAGSNNYGCSYLHTNDKVYGSDCDTTYSFTCSTMNASGGWPVTSKMISTGNPYLNEEQVCGYFGTSLPGCEKYCGIIKSMRDFGNQCHCAHDHDDPEVAPLCSFWAEYCEEDSEISVRQHCALTCCLYDLIGDGN